MFCVFVISGLVKSCFIDVVVYVCADVADEKHRLELCRDVILLLPDANRSAVYQLLTFLRHISQLSQHNQVSCLLIRKMCTETKFFSSCSPCMPRNQLLNRPDPFAGWMSYKALTQAPVV